MLLSGAAEDSLPYGQEITLIMPQPFLDLSQVGSMGRSHGGKIGHALWVGVGGIRV